LNFNPDINTQEMTMRLKTLTQWIFRLRKPHADDPIRPEHPQVALPLRADLPLRERSRALVAVPAQITGARMGSGKL
jgi:hypothetical protein